MARQIRASLAGQVYLIAQRGHNRSAIFDSDADRSEYLDLLQQHAKAHQVLIHAYTLLVDRSLILLTSETQKAMPNFLQQIGRSYARRFNLRHGRTGALFDGRYRASLVQPERFFIEVLLWMDSLAVQASLCIQPEQWTYSSCGHHLGLKTLPWMATHSALYELGNTPYSREQAYANQLRQGLSQMQSQHIEQTLMRNHALGTPSFIAEGEQQLGKRLQSGQRGRPRKIPT